MTRLEFLKNRLRKYYEAEAAVLRGQEYQLENRRLQRPQLKYVQDMIATLEDEIAAIELVGGRTKQVVFI